MGPADLAVCFVTVERPEGYLHATLESFGRALPATLMVGSPESSYLDRYRGDPALRVVVPTAEEFAGWAGRPVGQRATWNFWRALEDARGCRRLLLCEDDVVFARGWRAFLGRVVDEAERTGPDYVLTLYSPGALAGADGRGLTVIDPDCFYGHQAVLYAGRALTGFADHLRRHGVEAWERPQDLNLGRFAREHGLPIYATCPSLVQHVGRVTTGQGHFHQSLTFVPDVTSPPAAALSWDRIPGWFDFGALYAASVRDARPGAVFVEVGCWYGRSVAYLGAEVLRAGKPVDVYAVEHGAGGDTLARPPGGTVAPELVRNIQRCGLLGVVTPVIAPSVRAARLFADDSLDMVFLDADHSHAAVRADLEAWWPKVRPGGLLAGHDYGWDGVARAVHDFFGRGGLASPETPSCWAVTKSADSARP
jgi:hypothetical protein